MPSFEENPQGLVDGLFVQSQQMRVACIRKIKHSIIGNQTKKSTFMLLGVIPRLVCLMSDKDCSTELVCEAVITLGSFAHGTSENVQAVLCSKALPFLVKGLCHSDGTVVSACIRTLRTLYQSGLAPSDMIFQDIMVARQLVQLMSGSDLIGQCAGTILAKACQSQDHQNLLVSHGVIGAASPRLQSTVPKLVQAALQCLSAVVYGNVMSANLVVEATSNSHPLVSVITKVLTGNHNNETKLAAAKCLVYLCRAKAISSDNSIITLKVLPSLVRLCKKTMDSRLSSEASTTLAYLTQENVELQELAANSDRLIATLVQTLQNKPDENDDLVQEKDFELYDQMQESAFLALASLSSRREEIRMKVVSESQLMKCLSEALNGDNGSVRVAAARCLHSLSRSTKLLRTSVVDADVWKPILEMLSLRDEESLTVATGVASNLLLSFSPSREKLVQGGAIEILCTLAFHDNPAIQLNAVWALMSAAYDASSEVKSQIRESLGMQRIFSFFTPSTEEKLVMKGLGLLINLSHDKEDAASMMSEYGSVLLSSIVTLLHHTVSPDVTEQVMCIIVNIANASSKNADTVLNCDDLLRHTATILRSSEYVSLLMATCTVVKILADCSLPDHIHRQNCLEEYGIKMAVQKLEKLDNPALQDIVKETLDNFTSLIV